MPKRRPRAPTVGADATRRATRTLFQVGTVTALIQLYNMFSARPLTADQVAAVTAVGTIIVSFLQNLLEEQGAVPEMLKGPPPAEVAADLTTRKLDALAEATGEHQAEIERIEQAIRDLRADLMQRPDKPRTFTEVSFGPADTFR